MPLFLEVLARIGKAGGGHSRHSPAKDSGLNREVRRDDNDLFSRLSGIVREALDDRIGADACRREDDVDAAYARRPTFAA